MAKRTVLVVDDELTLLRSLRDALRRQGGELEVLTAGRADEALELMELTSVDLVVTDFRMPGQDGISFISTITQRYPNTRCILMTAHGDAEMRSRSLAQGAVSFLEKPFDLDKFISEVNRHLSISGFTGRSLVGFSLLDILQLVSMSQQSVTITVHSNHGAGSLLVDEGVLIHAETDNGMGGLRAAYEIVSWSDGDIASSRGVSSGIEPTIQMPLMTFLMEAAKHQDEVKRLKPLNNVKSVVNEWADIDDIVAIAVLDTVQEREVYGKNIEEGVARMQLGKSIMASHKAMRDGLSIDGEPGPAVHELTASIGDNLEVHGVSLANGRFLAFLVAHNKEVIYQALEILETQRNGLEIALADYQEQFGAVESGEFESINLGDELDFEFGESDQF